MSLIFTQYTEVASKIQKLKQKNSNVFETLERLEEVQRKFEQELKEEARDKGEMENESFKVKVIDTFKKWYDFRTIEKLAKPKELEFIKDNAIIVEVLREEFEKLVKDGKVEANVMQKAFREEKLTSKVIIQKL